MNPVLRENRAVLFDGGHVLAIYYYLVILLASIAFGALYSQSLGEPMWRGSRLLLKVCATAVLVLISYFALRLANQEYAPEGFQPLGHWLRDGRRPLGNVARGRELSLLVHVLCLVLLSTPFLAWAAAISRTPLPNTAATFAMIPFYALCYGVWGLVASALWEVTRESREFAARLFIFIVIVAALAIYLPLNPVIYLLAVIGGESLAPLGIAGSKLSAGTLHFAFHFVLGGAGLIAHRRALQRILERGHD